MKSFTEIKLQSQALLDLFNKSTSNDNFKLNLRSEMFERYYSLYTSRYQSDDDVKFDEQCGFNSEYKRIINK